MAGTGRVYVTAVKAVGDIQKTHQYDVSVRFDIAFNYGGRNQTGNADYNIACDGQNQGGKTTFSVASGGGEWVWTNIGDTKTYRITMPTSGAAKTINFSAAINTGVIPSYISASGTHTLSAVTWQWSVTYNANGGSGAPIAQTKTYGTNLTLSSVKPTRTNYNFKGWSTSSTATSATYAAGATYTANATTTLYAVWELAYWIPKISSPLINRCNSDGTPSAYGTCAKLTFDWECCQITGENEVASIEVKYAIKSSSEYTSTTLSVSGIKGSIETIIGSDTLSTEKEYDVVINIVDSKNGTSTLLVTLGSAVFTMDFLAGGGGVAIGKPAEVDGYLDINMDTVVRKPLTTYKDVVIGGNETVKGDSVVNGGATVTGQLVGNSGFNITGKSVLNGHFTIKSDLQQDGGAIYYHIPSQTAAWDLNNLDFSTVWYVNSSCTNKPDGANGWVSTMRLDSNWRCQVFVTNAGNIYHRYKLNGTWRAWRAGMSNTHKLWTGTLSKGGTVTVANLALYDTFMARTSDGATMMLGTRTYEDNGTRGTAVRFVGGYDDGNTSYVFKANTEANGTTFKLVQHSAHKLANAGITGTALSLKSLWGLM